MKVTLKEYLKKNWNVPNSLTLVRLIMIPFYLAYFARGQKYLALLMFLIAALTDLLDGTIARHFHQITDLGKLLDPVADKLMVLTVLFSMAIGNSHIPAVIPWPVVCIVLGKELLLMLGGLVMLRRRVVVFSHLIGKVAHVLFIAGLTASFFHDWFLANTTLRPTPDLLLLWTAVGCTLGALVFYVWDSVKKLRSAGDGKTGN